MIISLLQDRMKAVRDSLGLSQKSMSIICGFGENQWMLYENGHAQPSNSNIKLIQLTFRPTSLRKLMDYAPTERIQGFWDAYEVVCGAIDDIEQETMEYRQLKECNYIDEITNEYEQN